VAHAFSAEPTPSHPASAFADTPAWSYPQGEAGIVLPPAVAVDGYTADEVGAAQQRIRGALVAARLDHRMLVDHDPAALVDMFAEAQRDRVRKAFADGDFGNVATWLASDAKVSTEPPRVTGHMTVHSGTEQGVRYLEVVTNYVWVYAFADAAVTPAIVHDEVHWRLLDKEPIRPVDRGLWLADAKAFLSNIDCAAMDKGIVGPARERSVAKPGEPTESDPEQYYDPNHTLNIDNTCD
jgi:hypothetical protein